MCAREEENDNLSGEGAGHTLAPARPDLSWELAPFRELVRLAWPICVSMLGYSAMTLVDTAFVGRLGAAALAGVGLGGVAAFLLVVFSIGLLRGVKVLVSQAVGARRHADAAGYLAAGLLWALGLGIVTALAGQLVAEWLHLVASSPESGELAAVYLRIRIAGTPIWLAYVALREGRYGVGDARSPMVATLSANVVNIGLDYLLIFGLEMGAAGAAWASVVAQFVELSLMALVSAKSLSFRVRARHLSAVVTVGLPTAVQFLLEMGSFALLSLLIAAMSEVDMAAHQVALHTIHFSFLPALAIGEAASVLAGQAIGAERESLVTRVAYLGGKLAVGYTALCTVVVVVCAPFIARVFSNDPAVISVAMTLLYVSGLFQITDGAAIVARSVLRGAGDVRVPAALGVLIAWFTLPTAGWFLGHHLELGALGAWLGICFEIGLAAVFFWSRLLSGRWKGEAARTRARAVG